MSSAGCVSVSTCWQICSEPCPRPTETRIRKLRMPRLNPTSREPLLFQVLQKEPMRRAALVAGGLVSLTAMAAFIHIMQGPIGFHPAERKGHRSPIEMVMEHLNRPVSDSLPTDAARPVAAGVAEAAMAAAQNPGIAARATLRAGATQSSPASDRSAQTALIRVPAGSGNPLAGQAPATAASSLPPVWTGSWRAVDGPADLPIWFSLRQHSAKLSGAGESDSLLNIQSSMGRCSAIPYASSCRTGREHSSTT